ncbi:sodium:proton antiporter NhaD [Persicitalea jodogahamensis]|uniref:Sodium:proton antiporter n=1 Tax=Persicitalea jodogahamensis TaxID=402147 RepID=A0A8J3DAD0_9BACT|nr:sodium:proton antiporter NhaD [Persicitalea jodogahamensis]GHB73866.1 sodium:proton antiporter [Persicitalea jodogahamensis]
MALLLVGVFVLGYALIALEHPLKIDKAASALLTGVFCWIILLVGFEYMPAFQNAPLPGEPHEYLNESLFEHLGEISGILFFLLGAMTIVELVDAHDGFRAITDRISTTDRVKLLWIISWVSFFLSAGLDNMTTTIIMCALIRRIVRKQEDVWLLGGFVILAANAGGAFSPIGDVTTIMLWIGGQVTTFNVMRELILPSIVSLLVPLLAASFALKGNVQAPEKSLGSEHGQVSTTPFEQNVMFALGGFGLLSVPIFKSITHYPPYMGVLLSVGVLWAFTEMLHRSKELEIKRGLSVANILRRVDTPSILFFLGILLAVGALDTSGHLRLLATTLDETFGNIYIINTLIGLLSSLVDNVPLVAATMGMYPLTEFQPDSDFWNLLAYCAGTGGSILIIGSAAGVAAMGILKIDFVWYFKRISVYALLGYFSGVAVYYLLN